MQSIKSMLWNEYKLREYFYKDHAMRFRMQDRLGGSGEADWEGYFTEQKQKAQTLKTEIDLTDREIDRMVYELYGLVENENGIVEGTNN